MENKETTSSWQGSPKTFNLVKKQIVSRWGIGEAKKYDPNENCFTFNVWLVKGYQVKKGEKALKSYTVFEKKDEKGNSENKYFKKINLFYIKQVDKIKK